MWKLNPVPRGKIIKDKLANGNSLLFEPFMSSGEKD